MDLYSHKDDFRISSTNMKIMLLGTHGVFFATSYFKSPCVSIGVAVKWHVTNRSLQRCLNNQILDYKAILDLCENEMMSIKVLGICKERMINQ